MALSRASAHLYNPRLTIIRICSNYVSSFRTWIVMTGLCSMCMSFVEEVEVHVCSWSCTGCLRENKKQLSEINKKMWMIMFLVNMGGELGVFLTSVVTRGGEKCRCCVMSRRTREPSRCCCRTSLHLKIRCAKAHDRTFNMWGDKLWQPRAPDILKSQTQLTNRLEERCTDSPNRPCAMTLANKPIN